MGIFFNVFAMWQHKACGIAQYFQILIRKL